jgi:hypothetical protein
VSSQKTAQKGKMHGRQKQMDKNLSFSIKNNHSWNRKNPKN